MVPTADGLTSLLLRLLRSSNSSAHALSYGMLAGAPGTTVVGPVDGADPEEGLKAIDVLMSSGWAAANRSGVQYARVAAACAVVVAAAPSTAPLAASAAFGSGHRKKDGQTGSRPCHLFQPAHCRLPL